MRVTKFKKIFASVATFLAVLFFCSGGSLGMAMSMNNMKMNMGPNLTPHNMPCCAVESPVNSISHNIPVLVTSAKRLLKILAIAFFSLFSFVGLWIYLHRKIVSYSYIQYIRRRYGGWRLLQSIVSLFRLGILHPKTW